MNLVLGLLTCGSFLLTLWCWVASRRFPLHQRVVSQTHAPALTLLKPLKGVQEDTRKCLRSWFEQDYTGAVQILFGVAEPKDPVCAIVRELLLEFPKVDAHLIFCGESLAVNRKVSTLIQLEPRIQHDLIVLSDADVSVPVDFLTNLVPQLQKPDVGLVNCFYRLANPSALAMHWEALSVNSDFWSQVLQAQSLKKVDFALGAVMALRRERLQKIGGFCALSGFLADDYQLGNQIAQSGGRIVFSSVVVDCWETATTWKEVWNHQLRWARTVRACQPLPYFLSISNNATFWPCLWMTYALVLGSHSQNPLFPAMAICANAVVFRILSSIDMQRRLTQRNTSLLYWWMVPVKDLLHMVIWGLSFMGGHVQWHGERYRVVKGGKLVKIVK